jgi:hypothetical protein
MRCYVCQCVACMRAALIDNDWPHGIDFELPHMANMSVLSCCLEPMQMM